HSSRTPGSTRTTCVPPRSQLLASRVPSAPRRDPEIVSPLTRLERSSVAGLGVRYNFHDASSAAGSRWSGEVHLRPTARERAARAAADAGRLDGATLR